MRFYVSFCPNFLSFRCQEKGVKVRVLYLLHAAEARLLQGLAQQGPELILAQVGLRALGSLRVLNIKL